MIENLSGNQMLLGLIIGLAVLIFLVLKTKIHAFVALIIATVVIGVIGGMPLVKETFPDGKSLGIIMSITKGFGGTLSGIGIIIGFGVILGKIFEISGAAQRMAITFLNLFGKKREEEAMAITGFFVSIPIFCDSGFIVVSPIAKAIARRLGYIFIDTGAMYRAVTLYALEHGAIRSGMVDEEAVVRLLPDICIDFRFNPERGASDIYVDGDRVEGKIRTIEVSNCVSAVSSICEVRAKLVAMQQQMGRRRGVVMDGRDIGTTVFPDAELKIFMTARPSVRARRRYDELRAKGDEVSYEEILQNVLSRDKADMTRAISPLRKADDAVVLDNSCMTVAEQMEWFEKEFRRAIGDGR